MKRGSETIQNNEIPTQALKARRQLFSVYHLAKNLDFLYYKKSGCRDFIPPIQLFSKYEVPLTPLYH